MVSISPVSGSTNAPVTLSPVITFNERMDLPSVEESIFIAPVIPFRLKANWGGNEIALLFERKLDPAQTYVITVGTGARDVMGNRLAASSVFAISTGSTIDAGEITGVVVSGEREVIGAFVWAYNLRRTPAPNPTTMPPDYIVQAGSGGQFTFSHLSPGRYRVFAFIDRGRDRGYDPGQDALGVPTSDVVITDDQPRVQGRRLVLAVRDTSQLALLSVRPIDRLHVVLRFNKPPGTGVSDTSRYRITAPQGERAVRLPILIAHPDSRDSTSIVLVTAPQTARREYEVSVSGLADPNGNPLDRTRSVAQFTGSAMPDTLPPTVIRTVPADSATNVPLQPGVDLIFSEAVRADSAAIMLIDRDGQRLDGTIQWETPVHARFRPRAPLRAGTEYWLRLMFRRIVDWAGNALRLKRTTDEATVLRFTTVNPSLYGSVSGTVSDDDSTAAGGISLTLTGVGGVRGRYDTIIPRPGGYRFDEVLPGGYTVSAY
ncbi:MAG: Ig-like domain-containing protein, partial [Candidatus Latescibacteria bacterium]|nr:Ig-like domain-containing protein [Candidatus Latescibacterota bacterium]